MKRVFDFVTGGWGRVVIVALACAMLLSVGWAVRGWKADASEAKLVLSFQEEKRIAKEAADRELESASARIASIASELLAVSSKRQEKVRVIQKEIVHEQINSIATGDYCLLSDRWVRLYDSALLPASDQAEDRSGPVAAAERADSTERPESDYTEWDVAGVHAENASRWEECRSQLNALIDAVGQ